MESMQKQARTAGLLYLLTAITAPVGLILVPRALVVVGNAAATAERIRASEWLLRVGIASELFHQVVCIFIVLLLYRLFRPVSELLAQQLLILGALVSVPIVCLNVLNEIAALILIKSPAFLAVIDRSQTEALAYFFLRLHSHGLNVAQLFWGLWLLPFGLLVIRSGFIPRVLGWLLLLAGTAYAVDSFVTILLPQAAKFVEGPAMLLELGELPIIFWLAIVGVRTRHADGAQVLAPAAE
jgi:hypothetical protein